MEKKDVVLVAAGITITVLAYKLHDHRRKTDRLIIASRKLQQWTEIAQKVILETWDQHPELVGELPNELLVDINFYNIMTREDLN